MEPESDPKASNTEAGKREALPEAVSSQAKRTKKKSYREATFVDPMLLSAADIWTSRIFPFLGPGCFLFVAGVSRRFRKLYPEFFLQLQMLPNVRLARSETIKPVSVCNTFYSNAFCSLPCAKLWYETRNNKEYATETKICSVIARTGTFQVMKWACKEARLPWDSNTYATAALHGRLAVLRWCSRDCMTEACCPNAVLDGHFCRVQYDSYRKKECPWDASTCANAAKGGHLDVLKWARENHCPWNEDTCANAAKGGHLDILEWARGKGCPWNEETCASAAEGGHLAVLKWARQNHCPWNEETCSRAA